MKETLTLKFFFFPKLTKVWNSVNFLKSKAKYPACKYSWGGGCMRLPLKKERSAILEWDATPVRAGLKVFNFKPYSNQKQFRNTAYMFLAFIYDLSPPCLQSWAISRK